MSNRPQQITAVFRGYRDFAEFAQHVEVTRHNELHATRNNVAAEAEVDETTRDYSSLSDVD